MHQRAQEFTERAAAAHDLELTVKEFPEGTKTAADAADALGCSIAQIASSIVFAVDRAIPSETMDAYPRSVEDDGVVVVVTSGANTVDEAALADYLDVPAVSTADPETVQATIGWSIGGVPPFCHAADVPVYLDGSLLDQETVWAAAGTPTAVFSMDPARLQEVTGAPAVDVFR